MTAAARAIAEAALAAVVTADPTVTPERVKNALAALDGVTAADMGLARSEPIPRVLSAETVAELMNVSTRSLRTYARKGLIRRASFKDGTRANGFWESSVRDFLRKREEAVAAAATNPTSSPEVIEN